MVTSSIYTIPVKTIELQETTLEAFRGQVLLIVNTASRCGFTPQYQGLESLYQRYKDRGFSVLAFPCNQFGAQEPGQESEIKNFCEMTYHTTFPLFAKVEVNGPQTHPLFALLKQEGKGLLGTEAIKWNFTKFLIDRQGRVVKRFAPNMEPERIQEDIKGIL